MHDRTARRPVPCAAAVPPPPQWLSILYAIMCASALGLLAMEHWALLGEEASSVVAGFWIIVRPWGAPLARAVGRCGAAMVSRSVLPRRGAAPPALRYPAPIVLCSLPVSLPSRSRRQRCRS